MTKSFADLGASAVVCSALSQRGITEPFAIQELVIADVLAGRDVLAKSPTGSGKTLAFGVPIVERIEADRPRAPRRSCSPRPASSPARSSTSSRPLAHARALGISAVYGGVGIEQAGRASPRSPTSSSPPPAGWRT